MSRYVYLLGLLSGRKAIGSIAQTPSAESAGSRSSTRPSSRIDEPLHRIDSENLRQIILKMIPTRLSRRCLDNSHCDVTVTTFSDCARFSLHPSGANCRVKLGLNRRKFCNATILSFLTLLSKKVTSFFLYKNSIAGLATFAHLIGASETLFPNAYRVKVLRSPQKNIKTLHQPAECAQ